MTVDDARRPELVLEHLVWTTAARTLGMTGSETVVSQSVGWPASLSRQSHDLQRLTRAPFPDGTAAAFGAASVPGVPDQLAFMVLPEGHAVIVKTYLGADGFGDRAGRFMSHVILDPSRRLDAADGFRLLDDGAFLTRWDWAQDPSDDAATIVCPPPSSHARPPTIGPEHEAMAAAFMHAAAGSPVVVTAPDREAAVSAIRGVVAALPGLCSHVELSTQGALTSEVSAMLTVEASDVPTFASSARAARLDLTSPQPDLTSLDPAVSAMARRWTQAAVTGLVVPSWVRDLTALDDFLRRHELLRRPPAELDAPEVIALATSVDGRTWLAGSREARARLVEAVTGSSANLTDQSLLGLLDETGRSTVVQAIAERLVLGRATHDQWNPSLHAAFTNLGGRDRDLERSMLKLAADRRQQGALPDGLATQVGRVLAAGDTTMDPVDTTWLDVAQVWSCVAASHRWGVLSEELLRRWVEQPTGPAPAVLTTQPTESAAALLRWVAEGRHEALARVGRALPPESATMNRLLPMVVAERALALDDRVRFVLANDPGARSSVAAVVEWETGLSSELMAVLAQPDQIDVSDVPDVRPGQRRRAAVLLLLMAGALVAGAVLSGVLPGGIATVVVLGLVAVAAAAVVYRIGLRGDRSGSTGESPD